MTAISTSQREKLAGGPGGPEVPNSNNQKSPFNTYIQIKL